MGIFLRIVGGLVLAAIGLSMVFKTGAYLSFFGRVYFAERYFGTEGGSNLFYKLLGTLVTLLGFALFFHVI